MTMNLFSQLHFTGKLEREFQDDYFEHSLKPLRPAIVVGALLYAVFAVMDAWLIPEVKALAWFIRFGVVCPACALILAATYAPSFKKYMQPSLAALVFLSGAGLVAIMVIAHRAGNYFYYSGLILVIMYAYTFVRLRFFYATAAAWCIMSLYEMTTLWVGPPALPQLLYDNFLFGSANLIGMFSCYHAELSARKDFIKNREVRALEEQRHFTERATLQEAVNSATQSLKESEEKFRILAQTTSAGFFMHRGGKLIYANPAGEALTGYARGEILTKDFWELVHPEDRELIKERGRARLAGEDLPPEYEFRIIRKDGEERWISMTAGPIAYEGKPAIIGTLFDITDRRRAAEARERYSEELAAKVRERTSELEDAHKVAVAANNAKSEFIANVSHELRTPLNAIIGFSEVMRDGLTGPLTGEQREYLGDIWRSGRHLLRLINDILDLSKVEAGMMELELSELSLKELFDGCLFMFREKAQRHGIRLHTELPEDVATLLLQADERKIKQVVLNLVANALKFSAEGGTVGVVASRHNESVCISVWDTGIGISPQNLRKLFKPFTQLGAPLTKKYEGTGLGLHLSRKIVELHGGSIWAVSEEGKGSRFSFTIPAPEKCAGPDRKTACFKGIR